IHFQKLGIQVLVSSPEVIELAFDKLETAKFAGELGIRVPVTYISLSAAKAAVSAGILRFPLFVKPRWGTASSGIECVYDEVELELAWQMGNRKLARQGLRVEKQSGEGLLIQSALPGLEYGLDIVNDLHGRYQATFVKRKLVMRAGETDQAITETRSDLEEVGRRIGEALGHIG